MELKGQKIGFVGIDIPAKIATFANLIQELMLPVLNSPIDQVYKEERVSQSNIGRIATTHFRDIQIEIINRRIRMEREQFNFISPQTLLDHYALLVVRCHMVLNYEITNHLYANVVASMKEYEHLFFFKLRTESQGLTAHSTILEDFMLGFLLQNQLMLNPRFHYAPQGSPKEQAQYVLNIV